MVAVKTVVHGLVDFIQNYSRKGHETPQVIAPRRQPVGQLAEPFFPSLSLRRAGKLPAPDPGLGAGGKPRPLRGRGQGVDSVAVVILELLTSVPPAGPGVVGGSSPRNADQTMSVSQAGRALHDAVGAPTPQAAVGGLGVSQAACKQRPPVLPPPLAQPQPNSKYKTSMCRDLRQQGGCPRGTNCTFAHSQEELEK